MATSLLAKLQLKAGQHLVVLNAPPGYLTKLSPQLPGVPVLTEAQAPAEAVLLFVHTLADVERLTPQAIHTIKRDGLLWIAYPKGSSKVKTDVNRDILAAAVLPTGWRAVRQVAVDEIWSGLRFRPADQVGK